MTERTIKLRCYHPDCAGVPALEQHIPVDKRRWPQGTKQLSVYCARNHLNIITVPDTWAVREPVLGDDGVSDNEGGIPVVQGNRP